MTEELLSYSTSQCKQGFCFPIVRAGKLLKWYCLHPVPQPVILEGEKPRLRKKILDWGSPRANFTSTTTMLILMCLTLLLSHIIRGWSTSGSKGKRSYFRTYHLSWHIYLALKSWSSFCNVFDWLLPSFFANTIELESVLLSACFNLVSKKVSFVLQS